METLVDRFYRVVSEEGIYPNAANLEFYQRFLFDGVPLEGRDVLDVGGGTGLMSFYAKCRGARRVLCLEPEAAGSSSDVVRAFGRVAERLDMDSASIRIARQTLQDLEPDESRYDVIVMHNSINHLDEQACIALRREPEARRRYDEITEKIGALARPGAHLIVADCSSSNLFGALGLRNPFVPTIEWEKHQPPRVWAAVLAGAGFAQPRIRWSSFNTLRQLGRLLFGNALGAYVMMSHFCLTMVKRDR